MRTQVKNNLEIERMRLSGRMLGHMLRYMGAYINEGVTTREIDQLARQELSSLGGEPAFYNYQGFPAVVCISVNDEIVHGIPGDRRIMSGDIVGLDYGVSFEGMITDAAVTLPVGNIDADSKRLLKATKEALDKGIAQVKDRARIGDISHAIESRLREDSLGIFEDLSGHGVGHELHEEPSIFNYGVAGTGMRLKAGMTIAIEPMASLGGKNIYIAKDNWTILTTDGSRAAQFEHTVLVTDSGCEILTA